MFRERRIGDALIAILLVCAAIIWSLIAGKDMNFDQLHYHFYLGHSLFHDRTALDFMPANGQSYLNPLAYVPFYLMVSQNWHSLVIAAILAAIHGINIVLCYFITRALVPGAGRYVAILGAALAFLSPLFLAEVGTTFADVTTSAVLLAAVLAGLHSDDQKVLWKAPALFVGALLGIASALKLSNLVFVPAFGVLLLAMQPTLSGALRASVLAGTGFIVGFSATHGYWGWRLWKSIGNPLFPFFGKYFPTDILPKGGAPLERFLPGDVLDALSLPFRMMQPRSWIYTESIAPDLRFAALVLIVVAGVAFLLLDRKRMQSRPVNVSARRTIALSLMFITSYALWQWTSGNGRYGIMISILCGPLLVATTYAFCGSRARYAVTTLVVLVFLQAFHLQNSELRWSHAPWTPTWYEVSAPARLKNEPFLYVSIGNNSSSFIYPYLHPGSAFTNPFGQTPLDLNGPGGRQLRELFDKHRGRVRMLAIAPPFEHDDSVLSAWTATMDSHISRLGFGIDATDCEMILATGPGDSGQDFDAAAPLIRRMRSCRLFERPFAYAEERARLTNVARQVVEWCPKLFKPAYTLLERTTDAWSASYPSTDSMMVIKDGVIYGVFTRSTVNLVLGTVEDWERGIRPSCESFPDKPRETYNFD